MQANPILYQCLEHKRLNEIYCSACKTYMCPECVSNHKTPNHKPKYLHVMQYGPQQVIPKIDVLVGSATESSEKIENEAKDLVSGLEKLAPRIKEAANVYLTRANQLKVLITTLKGFMKQEPKGINPENMSKGITEDKKKLERLIKEKKTEELLKLTQRIEEEAALTEKQEKVPDLVIQLKEAIMIMQDMAKAKAAISAAKALLAKCNMYKMTQYENNWKCDRKYYSSKMFLSEDNLTFGNTATNGYPALIGDLPFDTGLYAFEVIPTSLECTGKEGFGIIEREKYISIWNKDKTTPTAHQDMMGYFYRNEAKNMKVEKICDMKMGTKYYVKVNIPELICTITGPGVSLKGELKPGVTYVPCFSCGCSSNRIKIRPLDDYDEDEDTTVKK